MLLFCALALPAARAQEKPQRVELFGERQRQIELDLESTAASRLGLSLRDTPASIELIDQALIRERGLRTVSEAAQAAVGVLAGDFPAEPSAFSMRGFANSQINTLYNGIKIGPANMTSRIMSTGVLERIEILKGPSSLMSGDGAVGGVINLVTRSPMAGPIVSEGALSAGSFGTVIAGVGSGGSTTIDGLAYRFDLYGSRTAGFMDDTAGHTWNLSAALDQRVSAALRVWGAVEFKGDSALTSWGIPLVSKAAPGIQPENGVVDGSHVSNFNATNLGPVTVDRRALYTNYNILDNDTRADENWLRAGVDWQASPQLTARALVYRYSAEREWYNNEVSAFNAVTGLVDRERFFVSHDQRLWGLKTQVRWDSSIGSMTNQLLGAIEWSRNNFDRPGAANFPGDAVTLINPDRGTYGTLTTRLQTADVDNTALALEDRLSITPEVALIAGVRQEWIELDRSSANVDGTQRPGYPFSKTFRPTTGRLGLTWTMTRGVTAYGQYATAADVAANNLFLLGANQPLELTRAVSYELGLKAEFWDGKGQSTFAVYDIERRNVYAAQGGRSLGLAGRVESQGVEWALALRPSAAWRVWGNLAYTRARYQDFDFAGGSYSGNTPPNVPNWLANAGVLYRTTTAGWPVEVGAGVRYVGARYSSDANTSRLLSYRVGEAQATVEPLPGTQLTLRVRNLTDRIYAAWADPFYPDQILIGAPRSFELALNTIF